MKITNINRPFTLLELLVVVAIIGMLVSILLPSLQKTRIMTMGTVCISNQKQIGIAMASYVSENDEFYPYKNGVQANGPNGDKPIQEYLWYDIGESKEVFVCPLDQSPEDYFWWYNPKTHFQKDVDGSSYMFNEYIIRIWDKESGRGLKVIDVDNPTKWPMASDGLVLPSSRTWARVTPGYTGWKPIDWWHADSKVGMLFGDGHVKNVSTITAEATYPAAPQ
ncbi:MAG: type II secretion system GspH family protein [Lentisphaerales bacterium]|nr:type II secretion system GspH family protein [Lentisphaerales bacterium]